MLQFLPSLSDLQSFHISIELLYYLWIGRFDRDIGVISHFGSGSSGAGHSTSLASIGIVNGKWDGNTSKNTMHNSGSLGDRLI